MRRFLLVFAITALGAAEAQDIESGLRSMRQRLQNHPLAQRKLSGLHQRAEAASAVMAETAAALDRLNGPDALRQSAYQRERLRTASQSLEADFASIEATLAGLGLPEKLEAWHDFVRHYRARLAEANADLAVLESGAGRLPRRRLPTRPGPAGAEAERPAERLELGPMPPAAAADPPTAEDLAETKVVQLTTEIKARAAALGKDAAAIHAWVAANVDYEPYHGQMQNSQAVLFSRRGNDFDQATLLIALLRASGVPARYAIGGISLTLQQVQEWMGGKNEEAALVLLGWNWDYQRKGDTIVTSHVWVEAWLDTQTGKQWVALDASLKRRSFDTAIEPLRPAYDRMAFLKALQPVPPADAYLDALRAQFHKKYPGKGFDEAQYRTTLLAPAAPGQALPFTVTEDGFHGAEPPTRFQHRIRVTLSEASGGAALAEADLSLPQTLLESLVVSFTTATAADRAVAEAFGGIQNAPAAVVNLRPEIRLEGTVIATGKKSLPMTTALRLTVAHTSAAANAAPFSFEPTTLNAGDTLAIAIRANQLSDELMAARISRLLGRLASLSDAETTRELLYLAGLRYFHRDTADEQRLGKALHMRFVHKLRVDVAAAIAVSEPRLLFDRPFVVTPGHLMIDVRIRSAPVDLTRAQQDTDEVRTAFRLHNDASSVFEHAVWEEMVMIPAVSTITILQEAIRQNVPLRTITQNNAAAEIAALADPVAITKSELSQFAARGFSLIVPQRPVLIGKYRWFGVLGERFETWDYFFTIPHYNGGDTGGEAGGELPADGEAGGAGGAGENNNTTCGDPVNVSSGNLIEQAVDYTLRGPGPGILFQRTYNSVTLTDGPFGPGWRHSYQMSLKESAAAVTVTSESGNVLSFPLVKGAYVSPPGYNLTLTKDAQGFLLRRKEGTQYRFNSGGALESITDRNQNAVTLSYESGRLRRITDPAGRFVTLGYNAGGRIITLEDFLGRRAGYEYDTAGRLVAAIDLAGNRTAYSYYTDRIYNHLLKSRITPEGNAIVWEYYGNGKVWRLTNPDGRTMSFLYLPLRNETHMIDPRGLLTTFRYNDLGNVTQEIRPDGSCIDSVYNAQGLLESRTDAAGYTTKYTYDSAGNLTSATDPLGRTVKFTYETAFHGVASFTDPRGNVTRYEYDARGNPVRRIRPLGAETRYTWDASGNPTSYTDAEGNMYAATFDQMGNPVEVRDPLGNVTRGEHDRLGRLTRRTDALGGESRREYDALDRQVRTVNELNQTASASFDREGRMTQRTDFAGRVTTFGHDSMGQLTQVTDALGRSTQYSYTINDCACSATPNLLWFRDAAGFTRTQTYDFRDQVATASDALGNTAQYVYDARGDLVRKTDANGNVTNFEYDAARQLVRKTFSDGSEVRFTYDANGNLTGAGNAEVQHTFTYDELDRITSVTDSRSGKVIRYSYNRLGRRTEMIDPEGGATRYTYDANGQMTSVTSPSGVAVQMGYDALGRATAVNSSTLKYDGLGRVVEVAHPSGTLAYAYDAGGNRTTITDDGGKHTYRYDDLNRLTGAQHEAAAAETYSYDAAGNRTGSAADAGYRYDAAGRLAAAEGATLEYDKNGNLASKTTAGGTTRYTWNAENQLARVDLPDGGTAVYKYDAFGRRIEKSVKGVVTTYLYDGNNILLEMDGTGRVTARYTHGRAIDQPLLMEREGRTYFYHADALGSVVALAGAGGNAERRYAYDTWGNPTRAEEAGPANPFLFAGREYDAETGLYYMRARYYDPGTGRFLSPDPLDLAGLLVMGQSPGHEEALLPRAAAWALRGAKPGLMRALRETWQRAPQRLNAYAYAANNPLLLTDPSGLAYTQGQCGKGMDAEDYYQQWLEGCEDADYSECDNYINPLRPTNPWAEVMNPPPLR